MNWPDIWGSGTSWVVGVLSCGLRRARKGLKKTFQRGPRAKGAANLKISGQFGYKGSKGTHPACHIFLQGVCGFCMVGVAAHPSRPDLGHGPCGGRPSPICALEQGKRSLGPLPQSPRSLPSPQPAVQASRVAVSPGQGLTSTLAPHEAHAAEACQNIPVLPVLNNHPYFIRSYVNTPRAKAACMD